MKKVIASVILLAAVLALVTSALADPWIMYTNKSSVKVYEDTDTHSHVLKKLKGGKKQLIEDSYGDWYAILVDAGDGQTLGWIQGKYLSDTMPQSLCSHEWGSWTVENEATCTKEGYKYRFCNICGLRDEKITKKLDHTYGKWTVTKEATCTKEGQRERTCSVCGYVQKQKIEKEAHTYGKWTVTKEATCTATGERYRKCKECGYKQTETIEKEPHTFGKWTILREATCTREGRRIHTCKVCGSEVEQAIEKLPHELQWKIIVEATDHSAGTRAKVCKNCSYQEAAQDFDPEGTLRRSDRGDAVREMQQLLVDQGYLNAGGADGMFGGGTEKALIRFQQDQGLNPDGIGWPQTQKRLKHDFGPWQVVVPLTRDTAGERVRICNDCGFEQRETIEAGASYERRARGEDIRTLQQMLNQLGYNAGSADGIYGGKLDSAFGGFAADHGIVPVEGKVRPGDVDAIVNAWVEKLPANEWKRQGGSSDPVRLRLNVVPSGEAENGEAATYDWTLTNLGSEPCTVNAVLLAFGDAPDFKSDVLVMNLSGESLKANRGNNLTGTFSADPAWGQGKMNFTALATADRTGGKWLSNVATFEGIAAAATEQPATFFEDVSSTGSTVEPIRVILNLAALKDGAYAASFNPGDIFSGASGTFMNAVHIYTADTYDTEEIEALQPGDSIVIEGETIAVETVTEKDGRIIVNDDRWGGWPFAPSKDGSCYTAIKYEDFPVYTEQGMTTLIVDPDLTFTDKSDSSGKTVKADYDDFVDVIRAAANSDFDQYNTTLKLRSGKVVAITRAFAQ